MSAAAWTIRRCTRSTRRRSTRSPGLDVDLRRGGASVSFMHPLTPDRAVRFWRRVARGVAAGERALPGPEDGHGHLRHGAMIMDLPENQPHRATWRRCWCHAASAARVSARR